MDDYVPLSEINATDATDGDGPLKNMYQLQPVGNTVKAVLVGEFIPPCDSLIKEIPLMDSMVCHVVSKLYTKDMLEDYTVYTPIIQFSVSRNEDMVFILSFDFVGQVSLEKINTGSFVVSMHEFATETSADIITFETVPDDILAIMADMLADMLKHLAGL